MKNLTAIAYGVDGSTHSVGFVGTAETLDAQKLYGSFNLSPDDVQSIIVVQSGKLILDALLFSYGDVGWCYRNHQELD